MPAPTSFNSETDVDDLVTELLEKTKFVFVALVALYTGGLSLTLPRRSTTFCRRFWCSAF